MSTGYVLINESKKEAILFDKIPVSTKREIAGNPASASIVTWYLLTNLRDNIRFYSDEEYYQLLKEREDLLDYKDVTSIMIKELVKNSILEDCGILFTDEDEPEIYLRDLRNIWMDT